MPAPLPPQPPTPEKKKYWNSSLEISPQKSFPAFYYLNQRCVWLFEQNKNESDFFFFLKPETDPDEDFKIMRTLFFYLDFCAFKWYVLGKTLITVKCWRVGRKAHGNRWVNGKQFWRALNQGLSGTVPGRNAWDGLKHISLCCSKGSVCHGKLTAWSTITQAASFFAHSLAPLWAALTSSSQLTTRHRSGDWCRLQALPKR